MDGMLSQDEINALLSGMPADGAADAPSEASDAPAAGSAPAGGGEELTDEEKDICRRGRNAKSNTRSKNASVTDYRKATGLEALAGYLYLAGRAGRFMELFRNAVEKTETAI